MTLSLTHLDKIYWKEENITKGDLIEYYAKISSLILPYLKNRPLVMHRYPEGIAGEAFFHKDITLEVPKYVSTCTIEHGAKKVHYIVVQNVKTLLYVINLGSIELHPFHSKVHHLEKPDYFVFDLDPLGVAFEIVVDTAQQLHEILEKINIPNFCKTSGKKGLHIYVPTNGKYDYGDIKQFAMLIAKLTHEKMPNQTSLERMPKKRQKRVYIDIFQNERGKTVIAPYSVRATSLATVSSPLEWKEVNHRLNPEAFTLKTIPKRIAQKGDLFEGVLGKGIDLNQSIKLLEKLL